MRVKTHLKVARCSFWEYNNVSTQCRGIGNMTCD